MYSKVRILTIQLFINQKIEIMKNLRIIQNSDGDNQREWDNF
jgi:hypothetical protein